MEAASAWPEPPPALWQWEHRTGFKDYDEETCRRIEAAYISGDAYVRLKTGKTRQTPMELFFVDLIQNDPITGNQRRIRRSRPDRWHELLRRKFGELSHAFETGRKYRMRFEQYVESRRVAVKDLDKKEYTETNLYKHSGWCAALASSTAFGFFTMSMVVLNSLWLGIDANFNNAAVVWQADAGFQVAELFFVIVFTIELAVRFGALKYKSSMIQDGWLCFDLILVAIMLGECLVMLPLYIVQGDQLNSIAFGDISVFRLARLLRLTRLTRVARLLRAAPEVLTMLKGITYALRTVFVTGMLLVAILYLFGIVFKIQSKAYPGLSAFPTVGESMWVLLLNGAFLDAVGDIVFELVDISWILTFIFMVFIFLSNLTILNMLVGILCEVATQVDKREKEQAAISYLKHNLIEILEVHDKNDDRHINKDDFELLMRNPEMHMILKSFGVDTEDLLSLQGILFESKGAAMNPHSSGNLEESGLTPSNGGAKLCESKSSVYPTEQKRLRFSEFLEVVLRLRGGNFASVRDIVDLREYLRQRMDHLEMQLPTKVPHRPVSSESTLRISASAGFDASSQPSLFCETVRPDDVVGKLLDQIEEVREELRSMRAQVKRLEDAKRAPEVEETQVTAVTPRTHSATSAAPTVGDH